MPDQAKIEKCRKIQVQRSWSLTGKFRIINSDNSEKKISSQYLTDGHWQTVHQLNWETGEYSKTDILSGQTTNAQIANWVSYQEAYGSPMMDFQLPSTKTAMGKLRYDETQMRISPILDLKNLAYRRDCLSYQILLQTSNLRSIWVD